MIKLCMGLCKTYINVILQIIFSPFLIFVGIFPTSKKGFSDWIINLIANLAVFPATLLFLIIANLLVDTLGGQGFLGGAGTGLWAPLLVQGPFAWFLPTIVGISAIAMLSKIPQIVPEVIFGLKPSPLGKAIGEGFGALPGAKTVQNIRAGLTKRQQDYFQNEGADAAKTVASRAVTHTSLGRGILKTGEKFEDKINSIRETARTGRTDKYNSTHSPSRDSSVPSAPEKK